MTRMWKLCTKRSGRSRGEMDSDSRFSPEDCTIFRQLIHCSFDVQKRRGVSAALRGALGPATPRSGKGLGISAFCAHLWSVIHFDTPGDGRQNGLAGGSALRIAAKSPQPPHVPERSGRQMRFGRPGEGKRCLQAQGTREFYTLDKSEEIGLLMPVYVRRSSLRHGPLSFACGLTPRVAWRPE